MSCLGAMPTVELNEREKCRLMCDTKSRYMAEWYPIQLSSTSSLFEFVLDWWTSFGNDAQRRY